MAKDYSSDGSTSSSNSGSSTSGQLTELRDRATTALDQVSGTTSQKIDSSPLIAVAGGVALGAILAAVLPQTERETELLEPVGTKLHAAGRGAIEKVRETGKAKVDELAGDKVREFFGAGNSGGDPA